MRTMKDLNIKEKTIANTAGLIYKHKKVFH